MQVIHALLSCALLLLLSACAIQDSPDDVGLADSLIIDPSPDKQEPEEAELPMATPVVVETSGNETASANAPKANAPKANGSTDVPEAVTHEDIWQRIRDGFQLSHDVNRDRVLVELKWYVNHPEYVDRVTRRAAPHLHYIVAELEKRNLPLEFALLPIVESAYDPFAYSHSRAAGLWQFIPSTARLYGLNIDWWYDGRRDVRTSTEAAINYLDYLHNMLNEDWLLALAAYNAGQGNVLNSIRASGIPRDKADFWSLKVLRETYTYVPRLLAISELINNPDRYHIDLPEIPNEPYWEVVETGGQLDLNKAAEIASVSVREMYSLNAGFNQWATHPNGPHELIIPKSAVDGFRSKVSELSAHERLSWKRHKVQYGESLGAIATRYRTTVDTIRAANDISGNLIRAGESLMIPAASPDTDYSMSQEGRLASRQARLEASYGGEPVIYTVKPGDSFWEISRKFDVGMRQLAKWNGMGTTGLLHPGTELKIFKQGSNGGELIKTAIETPAASPRGNQQVRRLNYRVRKGESLSLIASKFNITVQNIMSWNKAVGLKKYIHPGDRLTLYVDVTRLIN